MDKEQLFSIIQREILASPAYQNIPFFPEQVQRMQTLEALIWWLGTTNFSSTDVGEYAAISELAFIHYRFDPSHAGLMRLLSFVLNLDTPGFLETGMASTRNEFSVGNDAPTIHSVSKAIRAAVRQRPPVRKAVAEYIIFEELRTYDELTLAQIAERIEREYRWEFGDAAFLSSTRDVANALTRIPGSERDHLRKMLSLALEIGTHHIRSRLAVNWLAQARLRDPSLQQKLDHFKQMTLKAIWQQKMTYTTDDPEFINVLLRGAAFENHQN